MRRLKWLSVLLALLGAGGVPVVVGGCDGFGLTDPPCRTAGQSCGAFVGSCCDGPHLCQDVGGNLACQRP